MLNDRQWVGFCKVISREDWLADARLTSPGKRADHRAELVRGIEAVLTTRAAAVWLELLYEAGVPCGPINAVADLMVDPHLAAREMFLTIDRPGGGTIRIPAAPWRGPGVLDHWTPPPALGEHTDEVLREVLALSGDRIAALRATRVIA